MNKHIVTATDKTFAKDVLQSSIPVLVDFWAPWCGPCRAVAPVVDKIAEEYSGKVSVVKVNTDENPEASRAYGIMSIPTLAIFRDGKVVDGVVGAPPHKMLKELLDKQLDLLPING